LSLDGQVPSTRLYSFGEAGCRKSGPMLGAVDRDDFVDVFIQNENIAFCTVGPHSYMIVISVIPRQHIVVRIPNIRESYMFTGR